MAECQDCKRETTNGYLLFRIWRCVPCHEDAVRRETRMNGNYRPLCQDRDRRSKHKSDAS